MPEQRNPEERDTDKESSADEYSGTLAAGAPEPAPEGPAQDESGQTAGNDLGRKTGGGSG
jgi:hypothetical protein